MDGDEKITDLIPEVNDSLIVGSPQGIQVVGPQRAAPKSVAAVGAESQQSAMIGLSPIPPVTEMKPLDKWYAEKAAKMGLTPKPPAEAYEFWAVKNITFKGGPFDGQPGTVDKPTDEFGLLYFFREARGEIEQCVYRITLKEREKPELSPEATDEERAAWRAIPKVYDWVGEYEGKRRCPKPTVSGIRRESKG